MMGAVKKILRGTLELHLLPCNLYHLILRHLQFHEDQPQLEVVPWGTTASANLEGVSIELSI